MLARVRSQRVVEMFTHTWTVRAALLGGGQREPSINTPALLQGGHLLPPPHPPTHLSLVVYSTPAAAPSGGSHLRTRSMLREVSVTLAGPFTAADTTVGTDPQQL